jgi:hypothetical protein
MVVWACILLSEFSAISCYRDRKEDIILVMRMVLYVMWFIFDFTFLCARFNWLLNSEDAKFETMSIKTENKQFLWKGPKFDVSSQTERVHAGCNFTDALLERAPEDACKVWWVDFNADIHFQEDDWNANAAKFSVGFGLFIYAIIKMVVLFSVEMMTAVPNDDDDDDFEMTAQPMPSRHTPSASAHAVASHPSEPMPLPHFLSASPPPNVMPTETPSRIAPENANASIVFYGTAFGNGQGQEEQQQQQLAGGGARGDAPFFGTDTTPPPVLPAAGGGGATAAGRSSSSSSSNSSRNSRSFCGNLCVRMKKARISQGSVQ